MVLQDVFANLIGALDEHITIQKATTRNGRGMFILNLITCYRKDNTNFFFKFRIYNSQAVLLSS